MLVLMDCLRIVTFRTKAMTKDSIARAHPIKAVQGKGFSLSILTPAFLLRMMNCFLN